MGQGSRNGLRRWFPAEVLWVCLLALGAAGVGVALAIPPIQTNKANFFVPGTPSSRYVEMEPLLNPSNCASCHGYYDIDHEPYYRWNHSMMAQAARDPVFLAGLAIAEQDASYVGESCLRCHAPLTWLKNQVKFDNVPTSPTYGKSLPLTLDQRFGVACHICHRMVDPVFQPGVSPSVDFDVLLALTQGTNPPGVPNSAHNAAMVIDTVDRRRGPFNLDADWPGGWPRFHGQVAPVDDFLQSPFHLSSRMCATCHDVSSSHFTRQTNGSYALNAQGQTPAPSKYNQFPEQRTYSEWSKSLFFVGPVALGNRFGGPNTFYSSCQDCHMPADPGKGCALNPPFRDDLPIHNFNGANTWVLKGIRTIYDDSETELDLAGVNAAIGRTAAMLQAASDMQLTQQHGFLNVRIINYSGHKLPTGYSEGRRMWVNVKFMNAGGGLIAERGAYNATTAELSTSDTKVYEALMGPDATVAAQVGTVAAPAFRLAISNTFYKDNRIPPMGFTNAGFTSVQAATVPPNIYADGQYWDDTLFAIPAGTRRADVTVYYQTSSKEYMEFLRDGNTSPGHGAGQIAYDAWVAADKSAPVQMDSLTTPLLCRCDWNGDGLTTVSDIFQFLSSWFMGQGDFGGDGVSNVSDIFQFLSCWFASCAGY